MKKIIYLFSILAIGFLNSCEGPQGEPGPAGPAGSTGSPGATGAKGDAGTVNIQTTAWIKVTKELFASSYSSEDGLFSTNIGINGTAIDNITQKTLNEGIVLAYNRVFGSPAEVWLVPFDYYHDGNHITYSLRLQPKKAIIDINFSKAIDPQTYFVDEEFRIVVIPPASGARLRSINFKDYNEVKRAFNLKD
jgi:hypothetical protein